MKHSLPIYGIPRKEEICTWRRCASSPPSATEAKITQFALTSYSADEAETLPTSSYSAELDTAESQPELSLVDAIANEWTLPEDTRYTVCTLSDKGFNINGIGSAGSTVAIEVAHRPYVFPKHTFLQGRPLIGSTGRGRRRKKIRTNTNELEPACVRFFRRKSATTKSEKFAGFVEADAEAFEAHFRDLLIGGPCF